MTTPENVLLVRMLSYLCKLPDEQMQRVLDLAEQMGDRVALLTRLVDEQIVNQEWATMATRYLRGKVRARGADGRELGELDRRFGQIALRHGHIRVSDLEEALLEQERLRRSNLHFRLGEVLIRSGAMELAQVREVLKEQGCAAHECGGCGAIFQESKAAGAKVCPACGGTLRAAVFLDIIRSDELPVAGAPRFEETRREFGVNA
ncbi:MAG: hypothetical protein ACKVX7_01530 [Planctomycetota bacterium]